MKTSCSATVVLNTACELGEGLHWDARRGLLWFVDIHGSRLFAWKLESTRARDWLTPERVGWILSHADRPYLTVGLQSGFARFDPDADRGRFEWLLRPYLERPQWRLNDAKADSTGTIWAGLMNNDDETAVEGRLLRLALDGRVDEVDTGYRVPNGPAISPDERMLLHSDSPLRVIYAFDLDVRAGGIANKRVWKRFDESEGFPDGMCFDAEGCVWVAHWGGACVSRFSSDGRLVARRAVPAPLVTNVCFAGPALGRLFVTTARVGLDAGQLAIHPLSGSLFEIDPDGATGVAARPGAPD